MALHFPDNYDQELRQNPNKLSRLQGIEAGAENLLRGKPFPQHQPLSRFSDDVTAAMLVYRTIVKEVFWKFDVIIMQNVSYILPLFCTQHGRLITLVKTNNRPLNTLDLVCPNLTSRNLIAR